MEEIRIANLIYKYPLDHKKSLFENIYELMSNMGDCPDMKIDPGTTLSLTLDRKE